MKKRTIFAAVATPLLTGGLGVLIAQNVASSNTIGAMGPCAAPTLYIDIADTGSLVTGAPESVASCDDGRCRVRGAEQVEVQADNRVQCFAVDEGQALALTHRGGDRFSVQVEQIGR